MKLHKCIYLIVVLSALIILGCGCKAGNDYKRSIYNDNSKIAEDADRYYFKFSSFNPEDKSVSIKFDDFIGMHTIWLVSAAEDGKLTVNYDSEIKEGKFKVVYVSPDKTVTDIFEGENSGSTIIEVPKGKGKIKIIGLDAEGSVDISLAMEGRISVTKP
ncbi:hypothetical protein [Acetivibrio straminisolvens]|jgi:hypothetical protein|uniref:Lipoprotein n=1 Tax=Acetivibrio straminisolvens JCM 21531 TaxID=1294263 RepID=W4VD09_9FIRM|nr:hypothetical protein [Acetivibrio straminisolvens]GAE91061.1 hypothetical protein JCM21531_4746 [Acetivibrio straminisolvens JCM 21531]